MVHSHDWQLLLAENSARVVGWSTYTRLLSVSENGRSFRPINVIPRTGPVSFSSIPLVKACMELAQFLGVCVCVCEERDSHLLMGNCLGYVGCGCLWKMQSAALNLNFLFTKENTII